MSRFLEKTSHFSVELESWTRQESKILECPKVQRTLESKKRAPSNHTLQGVVAHRFSDVNGDGRYRRFVSLVREYRGKYEVDLEHRDYFISISREGRRVYFVKCDEIATNKGHVLIVGHKGKVKSRRLKDVLKEAHRSRCLIVANHALHKMGIDYFVVSKIVGSKNLMKMSMSKGDLDENINGFDAVELNSYFPEDWKKIRKIVKNRKTRITASSDAHFLGEFFRSYVELEGLDFSSGEGFKKSLKRAFRKGVKVHAKKHGFVALYRHGLHLVFDHFSGVLGIVRK
jgi:hypothetical protein